MTAGFPSVLLERQLVEFSAAHFIENSVRSLKAEIEHQGFKGTLFGASGGIDSLVTAALCLKAKETIDECRVVGFQTGIRQEY